MNVIATTTVTTSITITVSFLNDFFSFLMKKGILTNYLREVIEAGPCMGEDRLEYLRNRTVPRSWVIGAFVWTGTADGHEYWNRVDREWKSYLQEIRDHAESEHENAEVIWNGI